jgi:phytoene synthase
MSNARLASSQAWCERLARKEAGNFYPAFRLLPGEQRRAMCALYAFLRISDDLADGDEPIGQKRASLARWRLQLRAGLAGEDGHPVFPALRWAITRHEVPPGYLEDALDGVEADLSVSRYEDFQSLDRYCHLVAGAVGLACVRIWGHRGEAGREEALAAGTALQLTNILRDIPEDAARGRVYIPQEDLRRFGVPEEQLLAGPCDEKFRALMAQQAHRAMEHYSRAWPLADRLAPPGRAVFLVLCRTYRALLDAIIRRGYDVFSARARVPGWYKAWLAASAIPVRLGLWG